MAQQVSDIINAESGIQKVTRVGVTERMGSDSFLSPRANAGKTLYEGAKLGSGERNPRGGIITLAKQNGACRQSYGPQRRFKPVVDCFLCNGRVGSEAGLSALAAPDDEPVFFRDEIINREFTQLRVADTGSQEDNSDGVIADKQLARRALGADRGEKHCHFFFGEKVGVRGRRGNFGLYRRRCARISCTVFTFSRPSKEQTKRFKVGADGRLFQATKIKSGFEFVNLSNGDLFGKMNVSGKKPEAAFVVGNGVGSHAAGPAVV